MTKGLKLIDYSEQARERDEFFFWPKVNKESGVYPLEELGQCWEWTACHNKFGYGFFRSAIFGNMTYSHRVSFFLEHGVVSTHQKHIDHLCRNTGCVNPRHMELVSARTNTLRGVSIAAINAAKTHCIRGHEFTSENIILEGGNRRCRECNGHKNRERWRKSRLEVIS